MSDINANSVFPIRKKVFISILVFLIISLLSLLFSVEIKDSVTPALLAARHNFMSIFVLLLGLFIALASAIILYFVQWTIWQTKRLREQRRFLEESETSFQMLVNGVVDYAIYMLDAHGNIKSWNSGAERIKKYKASEVLHKHFSMFYTPQDKANDEPANALKIALATGKYAGEGWRLRKNGENFWASVVIDAIKNKDGQVIGYAKVTRDNSTIKVAEQQREELIQKLVDSNSELERFAFIATHDLQEPLRLICSFFTLLKQQCFNDLNEEAQKYIEIIESSALRMHALILDLLDYARVSSEPQNDETIDASQCLKYALEMLQIVIQQTGAKITSDTLPVLKGSSVHFATLLQNLLGNAMKYQLKNTHPVIHIGVIKKADEWLFTVKDNGIGMKQDYLEQIFEPFKRLHNKDEYFGTGMGLAICKKIVSKMGGKIWAESTSGNGSTFYFSIPNHPA